MKSLWVFLSVMLFCTACNNRNAGDGKDDVPSNGIFDLIAGSFSDPDCGSVEAANLAGKGEYLNGVLRRGAELETMKENLFKSMAMVKLEQDRNYKTLFDEKEKLEFEKDHLKKDCMEIAIPEGTVELDFCNDLWYGESTGVVGLFGKKPEDGPLITNSRQKFFSEKIAPMDQELERVTVELLNYSKKFIAEQDKIIDENWKGARFSFRNPVVLDMNKDNRIILCRGYLVATATGFTEYQALVEYSIRYKSDSLSVSAKSI